VSWAYEGINPRAYSELLKDAIGLNTFVVGLVKAPFMALVIIMTASIEGFAVKGSAESLGQQVTASVVKSIFMIILLDGIFAIYFAAIHY
jgi:phospholipid/cholesterol/gamma-HCH transport system permease protein